MTIESRARATACALAGGLVLGSAVGVVLGGAYWAGDRAQAADRQARINRLAEASKGDAERARQAAGLTTRLSQAVAPAALPGKVTQVNAPAARPFHLAGGDALGSARDLDCLAAAVYYEARGETPAGQAAVAQVVLNRVRHPAFPKSVCGVVFQGVQTGDGCQFSFACDGSMHRQREPGAWRRARDVASHALSGAVMPAIGNATSFHVAGLQPGWGPHLMKVAQVGLHVFYRFGGSAGGPGSFTASPHHSGPIPAAPVVDLAAQTTADGHPAGQLILASATLMGGASLNTGAPVQPAPAAAASAKAAGHDAAAVVARSAETPVAKTEAAPKARIETGLKTETSDTGAKPMRTASAS